MIILIVAVAIVFYHAFFVWPDDWVSDLLHEIKKLPEREPDRCLPEEVTR